MNKICQIGDCDNFITPKSAKGLCPKHYKRLLKGRPVEGKTDYDVRHAVIEDGVARIPIGTNAKDGYALVDEEYAYLAELKWHLTNKGRGKTHQYVSSSKNIGNGKVKEIKMHQLIVGKAPPGKVPDHENGNKKDNRKSNLRFVTRQQNAMNHSQYSNNTSGYIGAYLHKPSGGWMSKIGFDGKLVHIGTFKTAYEAAKARDIKAVELHGKYAVLNFPVDN